MTDQPPADGVTPSSDPGAFQPYTLPEAARRLGVGQSTVRRMVKAGKLRAETVLRPQGTAWVVYLPDAPSATDMKGLGHPPSPGGSARSTDPPQAPAPSAPDALAGWVVTLMAPLAEANARQHETIVSQAGEIATLREERGRQGAELERAASTVVALNDQLTAAESSRRREHRRLSIALAAVATLAVVGALAPAWVR